MSIKGIPANTRALGFARAVEVLRSEPNHPSVGPISPRQLTQHRDSAVSIARSAERLSIASSHAAAPKSPGHNGEPQEFKPKRGSEVRDHLTGEIIRHGEMTQENTNRDRITYLWNHKHINDRQYLAGQRLEEDSQKAEVNPVAASTVLVGASGGMPRTPNDDKIDASARVEAARIALGRHWLIVEKVVIEHKTRERASAELRIHPKRGVERLDAALHLLADHYRIG